MSAEALAATSAAEITARLDRLPMTRHLWMMVLLIALGATFENYDIFFTGYVAPGLFEAKIFSATTTGLFGTTGLASFIAALFTGLFIGTLVFAVVADRFGRRTVFTIAAVWYSICTFILAFQNTAHMLNVWRLIGGIGIGVELVTISTYVSELVPKAFRGRAFAFQQGIGFCVVPLVAFLAWLLVPIRPLGLDGWRWVVLIGSIGALGIWWVRLGLPESPRWLAQQGRIEEADRVMRAIEARVEAEYGRPLPAPGEPAVERRDRGSYLEVFSPAYRGRTVMMMIFNFFQTIGFYGFVNWVPTLLISKGITVTKSLEYTFIIALSFPVWPFIMSRLADKMERKWQLVLACASIAVFGILFSMQTAAVALIVLGALQTMSNAWLSFSFHTYQSELYPTRIRARGFGFAYSWSRFSTIFTGFFIAFFLREWGVPGVFVFIAGAMVICMLLVALFGPRTNQLALEEISK
ncbi:MAG: MFS transporter [Acetobacteraceae bacterium]|nr:MFS transporter [Acetobacteraceae bacterium]